MSTRSVPNQVDSIYHIYNRGVNKGLIFFHEKNFHYFIYKLSYHFHEKATILAFCLMPNHFHLLVRVIKTDFVQKGLQPFMIAYTRAINNEQNRVGPLFQGHYQSSLIDSDDYLLECLRYIHLNPVSAGLVKDPQEWEYSSYRCFFHKSQNTSIEVKWIDTYFNSLQEFTTFSQPSTEITKPSFFKDY